MYVELHAHANFSLLDGAAHPEDLVAQAAALGMPALALTDHDAVYGVPRFVEAARAHGIQPILGAELTLSSGHHLTVLVENQTGWANLCQLITLARQDRPKGEAALAPELLSRYAEGLIALSGCRRGAVATALLRDDGEAALKAACWYREIFGPARFWVEVQNHLRPDDPGLISDLVAVAERLQLGIVATNNVHYPQRSQAPLQNVLTCIHHQTTLAEAGHLLRPNSEYYLKSAGRMALLFSDFPEAISNSLVIAERCCFDLAYGLQDLPEYRLPPGQDALGLLRQLCEQGLPHRYPDPTIAVRQRLDDELRLIGQSGLANYFLIIWDLIRFARSRHILSQCRGSAGNALVPYLLGISAVDPLKYELVFERFLSPDRPQPPDLDLDFDAFARERVIQYVYETYGAAHVGMACTFVTFRARSAVNEVGKVLGLSAEVVALAKAQLATGDDIPGGSSEPVRQLLTLAQQIKGFPRHLGIHAGGMVLMRQPLAKRVPLEPATMPKRVVVQWDKDGLAMMGLIKLDLLGLRMLSAIAEAVGVIEASTGQRLALAELPLDDAAIYERIAKADTIGIFQVESRAQAQMLPQLKPERFLDLVIAISLIRPGPIQANAVHPYLRRRAGLEPTHFLHPRLETALQDTFGVILWQEQVLKVATAVASFSGGQGEQLRRALGSKDAEAKIRELQTAFMQGAQANGVPDDVAEQIFAQLQAFAGYAFPQSHAIAFAVTVYQSAWLKHYYPAEYLAALLNFQPMGFWQPAVLIGDARRHNIDVLPVDVNESQPRCTVGLGQIRLGFNYVKGLAEDQVSRVIACRDQAGPFTSLADFCFRTHLPRPMVTALIRGGAMDGWGIARRQLLWQLGGLDYPLSGFDLDFPLNPISLPELSRAQAMVWEQEVYGLSPGEQVMNLFQPWLREQGILGSRQLAECRSGEQVQVAGLVVVRQSPPTAKGVVFITLEDQDGLINIIVRPGLYARFRHTWRTVPLLIVSGEVQRRGQVIDVIANGVQGLMRR